MSTNVARLRRRRAVLAAVLALVAVPLAQSTAGAADCATDDPCVIITFVSTSDGVTKTVAGPYSYTLTGDEDLVAEARNYTLRSKEGDPAKPVVPGGVTNTLPLPTLLERATNERGNTVKDGVHFSEAPNARKLPSVLSTAQLDGTFHYANGLVPAVYATPQGGVGYLRPLRSGTGKDVNAGDIFATAPGKPLELTFHTTGDLLSTQISTSPTKKIDTKTTVSFSAKVAPETDESLTYAWNFTGGTSVQSRKAAPTHLYKKRDTYGVNLSIRGKDGSYGRAATMSVKVGNPPKAPSTDTDTGGGGGGGGGGGYIPPYNPITPPVDTPSPDQIPPSSDAPPIDDGLVQVEGFVLAGAGAEQGDSIPGTQATSQATEASELSTRRKISGAVIGGLAIIALLALGAEIETRWASTRLGHLRRRT